MHVRRVLLVICVLCGISLFACGDDDSGGTNPQPDAGISSDVSDAGDDGSAPDAQTASDAEDEADASSSPSPCAAMATARCGAILRCAERRFHFAYADVEQCAEFFEAECEAAMAAPGALQPEDGFTACIAALETQDCSSARAIVQAGDTRHMQLPRACVFAGTLENGTACGAHMQCASGWCKRLADVDCGVCAEIPTVGDPCQRREGCGPTDLLYCSFENLCARAATEGEPCGTVFCAEDLDCIGDADTATCQKRATLGEPCTPESGIGGPHTGPPLCDTGMGFQCDMENNLCFERTIVDMGEQCAFGDDCVGGLCAGTCEPLPGEGEPCVGGWCLPGLVCRNPPDFICAVAAEPASCQ